MAWKMISDSYKFTYDAANRLKNAVYGEKDNLGTNANRFTEKVLEYDKNGNIKRLERRGRMQGGSYGVVDNLTIAYKGNQLQTVTDGADKVTYAGSLDFKGAKNTDYSYTYNGNGSLLTDKSRGIAFISYDLSGNPQKIYFTNGSITKYVYSATGQKLRMVHYTAKANISRAIGQQVELKASEIQSTDSTDYLLGGSLVVRNGKIDKYLFDGGYAQATASGTTDKFTFYYQNKDHLGTVRETVTSTGAMKQRVNYYPFGGQLVDTLKAMIWNRDFQQYKYNGKEFDGTFGLNTYDYGARQHDPILARWDRLDPLCEKYYGVSPYAYCANNPVKFIDPDGRVMGDYLDSNGNLIGTDGKNDGRLYVLKTSRSSFDSYGNAPVAGITRKEGDISNKDNFVEITGSKAIREAAVSKIEDDGTGGTADNNNREYLVTFDKSIEPQETNSIYCKKGSVGNPTKDDAISVSAGDSHDLEYIHTHPSGTRDGSRWHQAPSRQDVMNTSTQKYVFGMADQTVYIYNSNGINATLPLDIYKNYEVTNGK